MDTGMSYLVRYIGREIQNEAHIFKLLAHFVPATVYLQPPRQQTSLPPIEGIESELSLPDSNQKLISNRRSRAPISSIPFDRSTLYETANHNKS